MSMRSHDIRRPAAEEQEEMYEGRKVALPLALSPVRTNSETAEAAIRRIKRREETVDGM